MEVRVVAPDCHTVRIPEAVVSHVWSGVPAIESQKVCSWVGLGDIEGNSQNPVDHV
jgi:hypothetical protein